MQQGVLQQDLETLRDVWAQDFVVNAPRNVVVPNREAVLDVFRKGIPDYSAFAPTIETIRITGDVAVVMGREMVKPIDDAPHAGQTVHRRYTHVWTTMDGRWQLLARHAHITKIE
jgi:ketosteroid isomerase-like protein